MERPNGIVLSGLLPASLAASGDSFYQARSLCQRLHPHMDCEGLDKGEANPWGAGGHKEVK